MSTDGVLHETTARADSVAGCKFCGAPIMKALFGWVHYFKTTPPTSVHAARPATKPSSVHQFESAWAEDTARGPLCTCGRPLSQHPMPAKEAASSPSVESDGR